MTRDPLQPQGDTTIRDLFPNLSDGQLNEAEENLDRYLELALRIYERLRQDPAAYAQFKALTASQRNSTMGDERSS